MSYISAQRGFESSGNTTTTPLSGGATFTGAWEQNPLPDVMTSVQMDTAGTLYFDFSVDGTNYSTFPVSGFNVTAGIHEFHTAVKGPRYFRIRIVNSGGVQSYLRAYTYYGTHRQGNLPINQSIGSDSDSIVVRSVLAAEQPKEGTYTNIKGGVEGSLNVDITNPLTGFGEMYTESSRPKVQIDAIYGLLESCETFVDATPATGSTSSLDGNFVCQTGTGVGGYGVIRSKRSVRYRPGQGALFRFTALFDEANKTALSLQAAGPFNSTNGLLVGYDGTSFGVMHRTGGKHEIRTLTISASASGSETFDLQLNSVTYNIPLTSGSSAHNAHEIQDWMNSNQTAWEAYQNNGTVVLFGLSVGPLSGTYSASSDGTSAGSIVQDTAGVSNTESWTTQSNFNIDTLDGNGPSGFTIDTSKGNVFQTEIQYLGYGDCTFYIENPDSGHFKPFHRFKFPNSRTTPTFINPTMKVGWIAASLGSTTNLTVKGGSALGAVQGKISPLHTIRGFDNQKSSVGSTLTSILAIRVRGVFKDTVQLGEVFPKDVSVAPAGSKPCNLKVLLNPTFSDENDWQFVDEAESIVETDIVGSTFSSNGRQVGAGVVGGGDSTTIKFDDSLTLVRGDVLVIAATITGGAGSDVSASIEWQED